MLEWEPAASECVSRRGSDNVEKLSVAAFLARVREFEGRMLRLYGEASVPIPRTLIPSVPLGSFHSFQHFNQAFENTREAMHEIHDGVSQMPQE